MTICNLEIMSLNNMAQMSEHAPALQTITKISIAMLKEAEEIDLTIRHCLSVRLCCLTNTKTFPR